MSMYNILYVSVDCPRCGAHVTVESEFRIGYLDLFEYQIGDVVKWFENGSDSARRPPGGNIDGEAYAQCPKCDKDFWLTVFVRNDRFEGAEVDATRKGYVP